MIDETILKRIGQFILIVMGLFSALLIEWVWEIGLRSPSLIIFITGVWFAGIALVEEIIRNYFKIPKKELVETPTVEVK